ncbi:hypothetical protein [Sphingobium boeckii]|uniref:Copper resistance protein D domain-containing protein n=1 Tax=Sphingobium boeckii TaxID=1082345 RepID=A0A7W9EFW5_9SPHN|nr:hypothetical protein [Sphingobium boeckii]MBB5687692.1 hypothetical protein [Sphingobium boeckii]
MDFGGSLLTFLHILIPIYWLGGDLGAFYGSTFMTDPKRSVAERLMALKILNNIDMAPRTALILSFPTGFALAWAKGWIDVSGVAVAVVVVAFLIWLALAWAVHLQHGGGSGIKKLDIAIRYVVLAGLAYGGTMGLTGGLPIPFFMAIKLCILAVCVALGLLVRRQLVPLFGAIRTMIATGPTPESDAVIAAVNAKARISVLTIWGLVLLASFLGIARPA